MSNSSKCSSPVPVRRRVTTPPPPQTETTEPGRIYLVGSGTGSVGLLTVAAFTLLTKLGTLVISDKLVPSQILELIPENVPVLIANKVPGNADAAQEEIMRWAIKAANQGHTVIRLKQGDPFVYGRGGEEVLRFRQEGYEAIVVPGVSSAITGPAMLGIPVTQRGVSDSLVVCTGVGRGGKDLVDIPPYRRASTLVLLMAVARLNTLISTIMKTSSSSSSNPNPSSSSYVSSSTASTTNPTDTTSNQSSLPQSSLSSFVPTTTSSSSSSISSPPTAPTATTSSSSSSPSHFQYPPYLPVAIIERASSPDQRLVASTLDQILEASEQVAPHRSPAMILIGWSVISLCGQHGNLDVLPSPSKPSSSSDEQQEQQQEEEQQDRARVQNWLQGKKYIVTEGLPENWVQVEQAVAKAFSLE